VSKQVASRMLARRKTGIYREQWVRLSSYWFVLRQNETANTHGLNHRTNRKTRSECVALKRTTKKYWGVLAQHRSAGPWKGQPIGTESYPLVPIYTGLPMGEHSACHLLARWFAELFFDPEDGGDTFLRNVGCNSADFTASYPRRWYSL
jgi:hypothetical protein